MQYENIGANNWTLMTVGIVHPEAPMIRELHTYKSRGRFNIDVDGNKSIIKLWFELPQDASYFKLKYT